MSVDLSLSGRRALVSGSTAGIGLAIAQRLAAAGAAVVVNGRTKERVDAAVAQVAAGRPSAVATGLVADIESAEGFALLQAEASDVDILIHSAARMRAGTLFDTPDREWRAAFETNVVAAVRLTRAALPNMLRRSWGRVIFVSSEAAVQPPPELLEYAVSKAAQAAAARGIANSLVGTGVTVNSILAGPTLSEAFTGMLQAQVKAGRAGSVEEAAGAYLAEFRPHSLLGRPTTTDEVAQLVLYLASELSSGTSGAAMRVDGGTIPTVY
jgi:NAD(P)-dependent dehydrogenase (short-subunit alcohol dehydrogenase family)